MKNILARDYYPPLFAYPPGPSVLKKEDNRVVVEGLDLIFHN
jgi:hypothetical protein